MKTNSISEMKSGTNEISDAIQTSIGQIDSLITSMVGLNLITLNDPENTIVNDHTVDFTNLRTLASDCVRNIGQQLDLLLTLDKENKS